MRRRVEVEPDPRLKNAAMSPARYYQLTPNGKLLVSRGLADLARLTGNRDEALTLYRRSLELWWNLGERPECIRPLEHIAALVAARGQIELAARLWGAAENLRVIMTVPRAPIGTDDYDLHVKAANTKLGADRFAAAWAHGRALDPADAITHALQEEGK